MCQLFCLRAKNTISINKWEYKFKNFPVAVLPVPRPTNYLKYWTYHTCERGSCFALVLPYIQYYFSNHWSIQIFFYFCDKALILQRSVTLSITNTDVGSRIFQFLKYSFVIKMFFFPILQADEKVSGYTGVWYKNV